MKRIFIFLTITSLAASLIGCVAAIGNRDSDKAHANATVGQQLVDLKKARDAGALTEDEYRAEKSKLLAK